MSYHRGRVALGAFNPWTGQLVQDVPAAVSNTFANDSAIQGLNTAVAPGSAPACPAGYVRDIAGNCTKPNTGGGFSVGKVGDFLADWFKSSQVAKGKAQGAAEGLALIQAQQQAGAASYLPYILIGGGVLAAILLLRK